MIGKYEREALERRRDELLRQRKYGYPFRIADAHELDDIIAKVGEPSQTCNRNCDCVGPYKMEKSS